MKSDAEDIQKRPKKPVFLICRRMNANDYIIKLTGFI